MDRKSSTTTSPLVCVLLVGIIFTVFWPVLNADFISLDDPLYVPTNPHVTSGFTWQNIKWAFTTGYGQNWFPLTWMTHMLDVQIFGLNPGLHHLTNLLFHTANTLLLFVALKRMTGATWRSAFVAALFAIHPLHVESVAWVAERKDVLSGFFFMLTLLAYASYAKSVQCSEKSSPKRSTLHAPRPVTLHAPHSLPLYALTLFFFACGLMSKPMLVTVPFVLLLLDFWPLQRFGDSLESKFDLRLLGRLAAEKVPFFLLSAISSLITMHVQTQAMVDPNALQLPARLQNAVLSYGNYLRQTFWPTHLAIFYPYETTFPPVTVFSVLGALLVISILAIWFFRRDPFAPVGWFWFLGMLVPTIGLVQVGSQSRADRYTYLPLIGIFILISWGISTLCASLRKEAPINSPGTESKPRRKNLFLAFPAVGVLIALSFTTHQLATKWQDNDSIFRHAADVTEENYVAWGGLGIAEMRRNDYDAAIHDLNIALKFAEKHGAVGGMKYYLGWALFQSGKIDEALRALQECTPLPEQRPDRNYRLGLCLVETGRLDEAEKALGDAVAGLPNNSDFKFALAALYQKRRQFDRALPLFSSIVASNPKLPIAQRRLADVLLRLNRPEESLPHFAAVLELQPPDVILLQNYAEALACTGKIADAINKLEQAQRLAPRNALTDYKLAQIYSDSGPIDKAISLYREALEADPALVGAHNDLAWILATNPDPKIRNGTEAVELAKWACEKTDWKEAFFIGTLAASYAETGAFSEAIQQAEKAIAVARSNKQDDVAKRNEELLALYRAGKAYHDQPAASGTHK